MDRVGGAGEAHRRVREVHPGRLRPLQAHDLHRLQLRPPRADRRQLGNGEWGSDTTNFLKWLRVDTNKKIIKGKNWRKKCEPLRF